MAVLVLVTAAPALASELPDDPTPEVMAGQMVMCGFRGQAATDAGPLLDDIKAGLVGGVVLFDYDVLSKTRGRNIASPEQLQALTEALQQASRYPLLIAVDQEGGRVARLKPAAGFEETYSAEQLARRGKIFTRHAARRIGQELARMGVTMNLAPVVDVNVNPESPAIGAIGRSFSQNPGVVAEFAAAYVHGLHDAGVLSCLKHFPGHGSAGADSHLGVTDVTDTWSEKELIPYAQLISRGLADAVMTGHLFNARLDKERPATLSEGTVNGLLRGKLRYDGPVISDDMQMQAITDEYGFDEAVVLAVRAGVDVVLVGNNLAWDPQAARRVREAMLRAVDSGELTVGRLRQSYDRLQKLKLQMAQ